MKRKTERSNHNKNAVQAGPASPGSIIAYMAMAPRDSLLTVTNSSVDILPSDADVVCQRVLADRTRKEGSMEKQALAVREQQWYQTSTAAKQSGQSI